MNVLLVEDDLIVQRVHQLMLVKLGCSVDIAENGKTALKCAHESGNYEMIFVDIGLPDIDGFELIKLLRQSSNETIRNTPIIALTGYCGKTEKQACLAAGATDVAYKPIVNSELKEILNSYKAAS